MNEFQEQILIFNQLEDYIEKRAKQRYRIFNEMPKEDITSFEVDIYTKGRIATVTWFYSDGYSPSDGGVDEVMQEISFEELSMQEDDYYTYLEQLKVEMIELKEGNILMQKEVDRMFDESEYYRLKEKLGK